MKAWQTRLHNLDKQLLATSTTHVLLALRPPNSIWNPNSSIVVNLARLGFICRDTSQSQCILQWWLLHQLIKFKNFKEYMWC
jgi:hypothetical protein